MAPSKGRVSAKGSQGRSHSRAIILCELDGFSDVVLAGCRITNDGLYVG